MLTDTLLLWVGGGISTAALGVGCYTVRVLFKKVGELGDRVGYQRLCQSVSEGEHSA